MIHPARRSAGTSQGDRPSGRSQTPGRRRGHEKQKMVPRQSPWARPALCLFFLFPAGPGQAQRGDQRLSVTHFFITTTHARASPQRRVREGENSRGSPQPAAVCPPPSSSIIRRARERQRSQLSMEGMTGDDDGEAAGEQDGRRETSTSRGLKLLLLVGVKVDKSMHETSHERAVGAGRFHVLCPLVIVAVGLLVPPTASQVSGTYYVGTCCVHNGRTKPCKELRPRWA